MRYLFGDSTEFPMQRDFLGLLDSYLDTSVKAVILENTVFNLKEDIKDRRRLKNSVLNEMDKFLSAADAAISGSVAKSKEQGTILQYAEKSKEFIEKFVNDGKKKYSDEIFREISQFEEKVGKADEENRKILESFFIQDPVPVTNKKYTIKATKEGNSTKVEVDYEGEISCTFTIATSGAPFWKNQIRASEFLKGVEIPARMKKPFLKKEPVPDIIALDDFYLGDLVLSGEDIEVVFRKKFDAAAERFRLKMNSTDESIEVYHAEGNGIEKNVLAIPELKNALDTSRLHELKEKIVEQVNAIYPEKQALDAITLSGRDALEENLVFELTKKVAELFAPTVAEIKEHSASEDELSLKTEDDTGKRSEIYLKKSQFREKLNAIDEKGYRLLEILDVN